MTPHELEALLVDAGLFPRRSRLEVLVHPSTGAGAIVACRERLAGLVARGLPVSVRRGPGPRPRRPSRLVGRRRLAESTPLAPGAPLEGCSVLVAEDDPDMRRLLATLLRTAGYRVVEAADGAELLARLDPADGGARSEPIGVVVSDVDMPELSGLDLLAALRCARRRTPVVLVTAYGDDEIRAEARALGAAALLDKPLDPEALRWAVATAVASRSLAR